MTEQSEVEKAREWAKQFKHDPLTMDEGYLQALVLAAEVERLRAENHTLRTEGGIWDKSVYKARAEKAERERDEWKAKHAAIDEAWDNHNELIASLKSSLAEKEALVEVARKVVYEIEGGNRWPVDWSEDYMGKHIAKAKAAFKDAGMPLPEWESKGPGYKRAALSKEPSK